MTKVKLFCRAFGLHPITAIGLVVIDWLLFGEEVATGGVGWLISLPVGVLLGILVMRIQERAYGDEKRTAMAKGFVAAFLTAIPAPLSSLGLLPMAAFGVIRFLFPGGRRLLQPEDEQLNLVADQTRFLSSGSVGQS